jgi:hypothetical protein
MDLGTTEMSCDENGEGMSATISNTYLNATLTIRQQFHWVFFNGSTSPLMGLASYSVP